MLFTVFEGQLSSKNACESYLVLEHNFTTYNGAFGIYCMDMRMRQFN